MTSATTPESKGQGSPDSPPEVSVIIATYNSGSTLRAALECLRLQSFTDFEVWIVGDACTDNSAQIVDSFADRRFNWINLAKNSGSQAAPNNEGIRRARGKYIAYLGHDDLWFPHHLAELLRLIKDSNADFVYSLAAMLNPRGVFRITGRSLKKKYLRHFVPPSSWLHKKSITDDFGNWQLPDEVFFGVDIAFMEKMIKAGKIFETLPMLTVLKFPSVEWKLYSMKENFPQEKYLEEIKKDTSAVSHSALLAFAAIKADDNFFPNSLKESTRSLMTAIKFTILDSFLFQHRPLKDLRTYLFKIRRMKNRKKRGL